MLYIEPEYGIMQLVYRFDWAFGRFGQFGRLCSRNIVRRIPQAKREKSDHMQGLALAQRRLVR